MAGAGKKGILTVLRIEELCLSAGKFALQGISLHIKPGEYFVLMGPTGSGKSLLGKCICGLIRPTGGRLFVGDTDMTTAEPRWRSIGYVPQDSGLFPHMDVAANITFPLRIRGASRNDAIRQVGHLVEMLSLGDLMDRDTLTLSGGERQKVAVARALAAGSKLLILDEPVSALDEPTRREICRELHAVNRRLEVPIIHVCHSVVEANMVADRIGILIAGRLVQVGPAAEIVAAPANETVARLLGL